MTTDEKKQDRRLLRTRRRIREAFLSLLEEKDRITVKELAERADIDRKTFYLHYTSTADVMEEIQDELLCHVTELLSEYDPATPGDSAAVIFRQLNEFVEANSSLYRRLLSADRYSFFYHKLQNALQAVIVANWQQRPGLRLDAMQLELYARFIAAGLMSIYVSWLENPRYTPEEVSGTVSALLVTSTRDIFAVDAPAAE